MKLLLDTQAFIGFIENDIQFPPKIKSELEKSDNILIISIASLWEITIKISLGKLVLTQDIKSTIDNIYENGFEILPNAPEHIIKLSSLEYHHRVPFDKSNIAQAHEENIKIVSSNKVFDSFSVKKLWSK